MPRKGELTKTRILDDAGAVFQRKGFLGATVSDLLEATGTTKGNLYFHFAGKEELGLAVLNRAKQDFVDFLDQALQGPTPGAQLENFFLRVLAKNRAKGFIGGCIFGNTALEASDTAPQFAGVVEEVFGVWTGRLQQVLSAAQVSGEVRSDLPADQLAEILVAATEGAIMQSRLKKAERPLARALDTMRLLLGLKQ